MRYLSASLALAAFAGLQVLAARPPADESHEPDDAHSGEPVEVMVREHDVTQVVLDAWARQARAIRQGDPVRPERIRRMLDFFTHFTDACHHAKGAAMVAVARAEHEMGRGTLKTVRALLDHRDQAGDAADRELADRMLAYHGLMTDHIRKENERLWPIARKRLSQVQRKRLATAFHVIEVVELGEGFHKKYHDLAMELKRTSP